MDLTITEREELALIKSQVQDSVAALFLLADKISRRIDSDNVLATARTGLSDALINIDVTLQGV